MTEMDYLKMKLEDKEKAFDKLFKRHMDLLKQQGELEKENEQLKKALWEAKTEYIEEKNEFSIDIERDMEFLKEEFERGYWND